ncbi:glycosyltransferase [Demequina rhizosphaerae]|uniref:glycosyltransferase n=1 Tax=Demequina rhizosphaerae TaxID=1638985 RepID=UPI0007817B83|nr:glycosyltransferase [Demequina rhizosphaerae]
MNVVVVIDAPYEALAPGRQRRIRSVVEHLEGLGCETTMVASGTKGSLAGRALSAMRLRPTLDAVRAAKPDAVVVAGFSAPHLVILAERLAKRFVTLLDVCDSWALQVDAREGMGFTPRMVPRAGVLLQRRCRRIAGYTYISARDARADLDAGLCSAETAILPQAIDAALAQLPPVTIPLRRLTVAADLVSFQNTDVWAHIESEAATMRALGLPPLEVYGKVPEDYTAPEGIVVRGWAPELSTVYEGDTGVVVTNVPGSGVPNKMIEALAAGRPVVASDELDYVPHGPQDRIYWWRPDTPISEPIRAMVAGEPVGTSSFAEAEWPVLSLEMLAQADMAR